MYKQTQTGYQGMKRSQAASKQKSELGIHDLTVEIGYDFVAEHMDIDAHLITWPSVPPAGAS